ncbi:MAG: type 4a pilus biogenesis protein PilO [Fidelibacterota bacterium]|jgi:Tfp pilus assembly protein PilO
MKEFLKNQRNAFFVFIALIFVILILWYFSIHQNIQLSYDTNKAQHKEINNNKVLYKKMEKRIPEIEAEWKALTSSFQETLDKIPHKQNYDNAVNALYNLLITYNFKISTFSPSKVPLEKKYIKLQDSQDTVLVEKYPIDIQMVGGVVQLGEFLDAMKKLPYRITANNIHIYNENSKVSQEIKLIAYMYLQSGHEIFLQLEVPKIKKTPIKALQLGIDKNKPFTYITLGEANSKAKKLGMNSFWWTNNEGVYFSGDFRRTNGKGNFIDLNETSKVATY